MVSEREKIKKAIEALENNRKQLGDEVADLAITALNSQLQELNKNLIEHKRKQMTILFMDVVDSTKLFGELDPEDNLQIMDVSLKDLAGPVIQLGGKVTRFMGDGYLAVFGLTSSSDNDPERAVRAGLEIIELAKSISEKIETKWGIAGFQVRVGINTGMVVTGGLTEAEDTLVGNAVNLASRLENAALPGEVLISHYTFPHVRGKFAIASEREISVKGFKEKILAYSISKLITERPRIGPIGILGSKIPLTGRGKELGELNNQFMKMVRLSKSKSVLIDGDVGLGKTRLYQEFINLVKSENQIEVFTGVCTVGTENHPLGLIRTMMSQYFEINEEDSILNVKEKIDQKIRVIFPNKETLERETSLLGHFFGFDFREDGFVKNLISSPQQLYDRGYRYLKEYIRTLSWVNPIIIGIDNYQWADNSSLAIFQQLKDDLPDIRIMYVVLARPIGRPQSDLNSKYDHIINLKPLDQKNSRILIHRGLSKINSPPEELIDFVEQHMDGVPYIMEETINMLIENKIFQKKDKKWEFHRDRMVDFQIPHTLTGIIQARLENLSLPERNVLEQASVIGSLFWDNTVEYINEMVNNSNGIKINDVLDKLAERGWITRVETSSISNSNEFIFNSNLVREITYHSILKYSKQKYHEKIAEWLIEKSQKSNIQNSSEIAYHYLNANKHHEASIYYRLGGDEAIDASIFQEAAKFYAKSLSLMDADDLDEKYKTLIKYQECTRIIGDKNTNSIILDELTSLVTNIEDEEKKLEVLLLKGWDNFWESEFEIMASRGQEAIILAKSIDNLHLLQRAHYLMAWAYLNLDNLDLASFNASKSLDLARNLNNLREEGNSLNIHGLINISRGDFYSAIMCIEGFLSIANQLEDLERELTASSNLGICYIRLGKIDAAIELFEKNHQIAEEVGDVANLSTLLINWGWAEASKQNWKKGLEISTKAIKLKSSLKHNEAVAEGNMWQGHCYFGLENFQAAQESYLTALKIRRELGQTALAMGAIASLCGVGIAKNDINMVKIYNQELCEYISNNGDLRSTWEPFRIYLSSIESLIFLNDNRFKGILANTHEKLIQEAEKINHTEDRDLFLEIPWHKKLIELHSKQ